MISTQHLSAFLLSVAIVLTGYALVAINMHRKSYKAQAIRAAQRFMEEQRITQEKLSPTVEFCRAAVRSVGVNIEAFKQDNYVPLGRAGLLNDTPLAYFLFFRWFVQPLFLVAALMIAMPMLSNKGNLGGLTLLGYGIGLGILAYLGLKGNVFIMKNRTQKRNRFLYTSFPDAVELLMICIEAGQSLDSALGRICQELRAYHPVITEELDRTRLELGLTTDRIKALNNLAERTNSSGFRSLVSALVQSERYGTNMASTLRTLADDFRTSRLLNAENKAARVPALMTLPLIMFIFFPFIGMIMAPPMIQLSSQNVFGR
jgi:tight adherence protein C